MKGKYHVQRAGKILGAAAVALTMAAMPGTSFAAQPFTVGQTGLTQDMVTISGLPGTGIKGQAQLQVVAGKGVMLSLSMSGLQPGKSYSDSIHYGMAGTMGPLAWKLPMLHANASGVASVTMTLPKLQAIPENGWYIRVADAAGTGTGTGIKWMTVAHGNIGVALPSTVAVATAETKDYLISLQIGPLAKMISEAQAKQGMHGEIMVPIPGMSMPSMSMMFDGHMVNHHLEAHIFNRLTGAVVENEMPTISIQPAGSTHWQALSSAVAMYGTRLQLADYHYGNNVYMKKGDYTITVTLHGQKAVFSNLQVFAGSNSDTMGMKSKMPLGVSTIDLVAGNHSMKMPVSVSMMRMGTSMQKSIDVPLWYVMQQLHELGVTSKWNGHELALTSLQVNHSTTPMMMKGNAGIWINGKMEGKMMSYVAKNPLSGTFTMFVSAKAVSHILSEMKLRWTMHDGVWTILPMTSSNMTSSNM